MSTDLQLVDTAVLLYYSSAWNDISAYVYQRDPIHLSSGTPNEAPATDPASCRFTLNNRAGRFSTRNPLSPLYGLIGRNTPVMVLAGRRAANNLGLVVGEGGQAAGGATSPTNAALNIISDIDLRAEFVPMSNYGTQCLVAKGYTGSAQLSYELLYDNSGTTPHLTMRWSVDGTTVSFVDHNMAELVIGKRIAVRATLKCSDGSGNRVISFYTSSDQTITGTWNLHGSATTTAGTTSIFSGTGTLTVGQQGNANGVVGNIYAVRVLNGIGGTEVANPNFKSQTENAASFTDSAGRVWTIASGSRIGYYRSTRFVGEVSAWPQAWDVSGTDVYVQVEAAGIQRRLAQGQPPAVSDPVRDYIKTTTWQRCWPGLTASELGGFDNGHNLHYGRNPLVAVGTSLVTYGTAGITIPTTNAVRNANGYIQTGYLEASLVMSESSQLVLGFSFQATSLGVLSFILPDYGGNLTYEYEVRLRADGTNNDVLVIQRLSNDGTITVTNLGHSGALSALTDGAQHACQLVLTTSGSDTLWAAYIDGVLATSGTALATVLTGTYDMHIVYEPSASNSSVVVSYITLWQDSHVPTLTDYPLAVGGYAGETSGARLVRLCAANSVPLRLIGTAASTIAMGAQPDSNKLLDLLTECANADMGTLYDDPLANGLVYKTRASYYNQVAGVTLDYSAGVFAKPLNPTDDDLNLHNVVTATSTTGNSSATASLDTGALSTLAPPNGIGTYPASASVNVQTAGSLDDIAAWLLHRWTYDAARYPALGLSLLTPAVVASTDLVNQITALGVGSWATITHLPAWLPPDDVSVLLLGMSEDITPFQWDITFNAAPASPYQVAVYGATQGDSGARFDTEGSTTTAGVNTTATSLSVATTSGQLWTVDAAAFPFDIRVAGERMTVSLITGGTSPQTFTVIRSVNGVVKSHLSGEKVCLFNTPRYGL